MATSYLTMTIKLYLFCSFFLPIHLVCLRHLDHSAPLDLVVTTALLRTIGIALCRFSCTEVMVPYGLVWSVVCERLLSQPFLLHCFFWFPSITMMSRSEGSGLLCFVAFLRFSPFAMASKSKSGRSCYPCLSLC